MATTVVNPTFKDAQWLSDHAGGEGMVVSCYADTSPSGVRPLWREHLKNEVKRIDDTLSGNSAATREFHRNIAAIEGVLSSRRPVSARGMAIFAASQRNLLQAYALASVVPNRLVIDEEPYVLPLLELLHRQRRYLVVHTDTHRGRLYTAVPGAVHMIEEIETPVPKRHRAAGELWGKQQATIARHREDHVVHHLKGLASAIERAWPEERYDGIVLLGEHEVLETLRTYLPEALGSRVAGEAPHAWVGRQTPLVSKIESIHAEALRDQERRLFEDIKRRLLEHHQVVTASRPSSTRLRTTRSDTQAVSSWSPTAVRSDRDVPVAADCSRKPSASAHRATPDRRRRISARRSLCRPRTSTSPCTSSTQDTVWTNTVVSSRCSRVKHRG